MKSARSAQCRADLHNAALQHRQDIRRGLRTPALSFRTHKCLDRRFALSVRSVGAEEILQGMNVLWC
ncbi:hypothetical protein AOLI_G00186590 [Acnodon oligacanthus]